MAREPFSRPFQVHVAATACRSKHVMARLQSVLSPDFFDDAIVGDIVAFSLEHFKEHGELLSMSSIVEALNDEDSDEVVEELWNEEIADANFVIDKMIEFAKQKAVEQAALEIAERVSRGEHGSIIKIAQDALMVGADLADIGEYVKAGLDDRRTEYTNPSSIERVRTGISHLDEILGGGVEPGTLNVFLAPPKAGKCVASYTSIWTTEAGYSSMEDLRHSDGLHVIGLSKKTQKPQKTRIIARSSVGRKAVYNIRLSSGRLLKGFAGTHPVRTLGGYVPVSELQKRDAVISPARLPLTGRTSPRFIEFAYIIGLFIGDGCMRIPNALSLTMNVSEKAILDYVVDNFPGNSFLRSRQVGNALTYFFNSEGKHLFNELGIGNVLSKNKTIPKIIFEWGESAVAAFIAGLLDADSHFNEKGVELTLASRDLIEDVVSCLHVLGIYTSYSPKKASCNGKVFDAYRIYFSHSRDLRILLNSVSRYGRSCKWTYLAQSISREDRVHRFNAFPSSLWQEALDYLKGANRHSGKNCADLYRRLSYQGNARKASEFFKRNLARNTPIKFEDARIIMDYCSLDTKKHLAQEELVYDYVEEVILDKIVECFDLQTDSATNSYVAEGVFTHNSFCLVNVGYGAAKGPDGVNVVHYSLELRRRALLRRYDRRAAGKKVNILKDTDARGYVKRLKKRHSNLMGGDILVKYWPTRQAGVSSMRAHLSHVISMGFNPGLIIVDYAGIVKPETRANDDFRHQQAGICEDLRGLAGEFELPLWTAWQANRGSLEKEVVTMQDVSESFEVSMILDTLIAICRTEEEKVKNLGRLFSAAMREGAGEGRIIECAFDLENSLVRSIRATAPTFKKKSKRKSRKEWEAESEKSREKSVHRRVEEG